MKEVSSLLEKYTSEYNLLEGIKEQYHQAYKEDIEQSFGFAFYRLKSACMEFVVTVKSNLKSIF